MTKNQKYYFVEQVIASPQTNIGYSFPDIIKEDSLIKKLVNTIESDTELKLIVLGDASRPEAPLKTAQEIWSLLSKYSIGKQLLDQYPGIEKYRISAVPVRSTYFKIQPGEEQQDTPFHKFDLWANSSKRESGETMPSFREYVTNPNKYNPQQTSGAATKTPNIK